MLSALSPRSVAEYLVWLAIAAFFFGFSFAFEPRVVGEGLAPHVWPRIFAIVTILVATAYLLQASSDAVDAADREGTKVSLWAALKLFLAPIAFTYLLPVVGFYVAVPLFLAAQLLVLGERRPLIILGTVIGVFAAIVFVFTVLFFVALPVGTAEPFYTLNTAIVSTLR